MYIYDFSIAKTFYSPPFTGGGAGGRGLPRYSRIERPKGFERCEAALNRAFGALNRPQAIERGFAAFERCVAALNRRLRRLQPSRLINLILCVVDFLEFLLGSLPHILAQLCYAVGVVLQCHLAIGGFHLVIGG